MVQSNPIQSNPIQSNPGTRAASPNNNDVSFGTTLTKRDGHVDVGSHVDANFSTKFDPSSGGYVRFNLNMGRQSISDDGRFNFCQGGALWGKSFYSAHSACRTMDSSISAGLDLENQKGLFIQYGLGGDAFLPGEGMQWYLGYHVDVRAGLRGEGEDALGELAIVGQAKGASLNLTHAEELVSEWRLGYEGLLDVRSFYFKLGGGVHLMLGDGNGLTSSNLLEVDFADMTVGIGNKTSRVLINGKWGYLSTTNAGDHGTNFSSIIRSVGVAYQHQF